VSSSKQNTGKTGSGKAAPISAHPAFPAMVAIWFAALFGLGSLVLPSALPERIVTLTGADALIPAMAPPLGFKARALIALAATVVGGVGGLALARRIVAAQRRNRQSATAAEPRLRNADRHPDAPARRPISALEELGEDRLPEFRPELRGTLAEELGVSWEDVLSEKEGRRSTPASLAQPVIEGPVIDLPAIERPHDEAARQWTEPGAEPAGDEIEPVEQALPEEIAEEMPAAEDMPFERSEWGDADEAFIEAGQEPGEQPGTALPPAASPMPEVAEAALELDEDDAIPSGRNPAIREAPLAELGVTDLVERLAYAIQIRQQRPVAVDESLLARKAPARQWPAAPDRAPAPDGAGDDSPALHPMPAALRPFGFDEEDDEDGVETDLALSDLGLPGHSIRDHREPAGFGDLPAYQAEDFANESEADEDEDATLAEESYSSLLNLKMGVGRPPQGEEPDEPEASGDTGPPTQESPTAAGEAPAEPDAADKALREALARLQRISGAA